MWPNERDRMLAERIIEDIDVVQRRIGYLALTKERFCNDHSFEGELAYDTFMNPVYRFFKMLAIYHLLTSIL